ncbi:MAG: ATP phosphoribosyltransferase [bacterium]|nr:ATP phosphoribosyltransferase [bacterium]MDT8365721.1 ATP phosphoribosyltransferase [bacterium]
MRSWPPLAAASGGPVDKNAITIALPKGRLMPDCVRILSEVGLRAEEDLSTTRRLLVPSEEGSARFLIIRDKDLPTYVDSGAADMGIVGKDVLMESKVNILEPLDLGFGYCRIVVAQPAAALDPDATPGWGHTRVATKYPYIAQRHFASLGEQIEIIPLYGSIELAPLVGLADRIVDLVSTGETLRQNNLVEVQDVMEVTARLVVNRASMKIKADRLVPIIEAIRGTLKHT